MRGCSGFSTILLGLALAVLGVILPLLMLLRMIPTNFTLSFVAYAASVVGVLLGVVGAAQYVISRRRDRPDL